jgi:hypothetical protein
VSTETGVREGEGREEKLEEGEGEVKDEGRRGSGGQGKANRSLSTSILLTFTTHICRQGPVEQRHNIIKKKISLRW